MIKTDELEDLRLTVSAAGTEFSPAPYSPFDAKSARFLHSSDDPESDLRLVANEVLIRPVNADPSVRYVAEVVDEIVGRIRKRGGCTTGEADALYEAVHAAADAAAFAVIRAHVREIRVGSLSIQL